MDRIYHKPDQVQSDRAGGKNGKLTDNKMLPVFLGLSMGLLVVLDPIISLPIRHDLPDAPFLLSGSLLFATLIIFAITALAKAQWFRGLSNKDTACVVLLVTTYHANSLGVGPVDLSELTIFMFTVLMIVSAMVYRERFVTTPLAPLMLTFLLLALLSAILVKGFVFIPKIVKLILVFLLLLVCMCRGAGIFTFARSVIVVTTISSIFAIAQLIYYATTGGLLMLITVDESMLKYMFETTSFGRVFRSPALTLSYRIFGELAASAVILIFALLLYRTRVFGWRKERVILWALLAINTGGVVVTFSNDILLGTVLGVIVLLIIHNKAWLVRFAVIGLVLAFAATVYLGIAPGRHDNLNYTTKMFYKSERDRIYADQAGLEGFIHEDRFWLGIGVERGNRYTGHAEGWPAHNAFILVADEVGWAGLAAFAAIHLFIFYRLIGLQIAARRRRDKAFAAALLASITMLFVGEQFTAAYIDPWIWIYFAATEAMHVRLRRQHPPRYQDQAYYGRVVIDK